jgi:transposase
MISLPPGTKVYLASKPVSMRLGFDGLAALVRPCSPSNLTGDMSFCFAAKAAII